MPKDLCCAIDNRTPYSFLTTPLEDRDLWRYIHPGKTWLTNNNGYGWAVPDLADRSNNGWQFSFGNSSFYFVKHVVNGVTEVGYYTDPNNPVQSYHKLTTTLGIDETNHRLSIVIDGHNLPLDPPSMDFTLLRVEIIKEWFPDDGFRGKPVLAGLKNNTCFLVRINPPGVNKKIISIPPYSYSEDFDPIKFPALDTRNYRDNMQSIQIWIIHPQSGLRMLWWHLFAYNSDLLGLTNREYIGTSLVGGSSQIVGTNSDALLKRYLELSGPDDIFGEPTVTSQVPPFLRMYANRENISNPPYRNAMRLVSIENKTRFRILADTESTPFDVYPGRTWTTHDGWSGWSFPTHEAMKKGTSTQCARLRVIDNTNSVAAVYKLVSLGDDKLVRILDDTGDKYVVIATGLKDTLNSFQLDIFGTDPSNFSFSVRHNTFPRWEISSSGLAGVMNNSVFNMTVQSNNYGLTSTYAVPPGKFADLGASTLMLCAQELHLPPYNNFIEPKTELPVSQGGINIPPRPNLEAASTCTGNDAITITLESTPPQEWTIFRHNVSIVQWKNGDNTEFGHWAKLIEGGSSQLDSPLKYLDVVGPDDVNGESTFIESSDTPARLRMTSNVGELRPCKIVGHPFDPIACALRLKHSTTTMDAFNLSATGELTQIKTHVTRIRCQESEGQSGPTLFPNASVRIVVYPPVNSWIGKNYVPRAYWSNPNYYDTTLDENSEIVVKTEASNSLAASRIGITILDTKDGSTNPKRYAANGATLTPTDAILSKLAAIQTPSDLRFATDLDGGLVFSGTHIFSRRIVESYKDMITLAWTPSALIPRMMPSALGQNPYECVGDAKDYLKRPNHSEILYQSYSMALDMTTGLVGDGKAQFELASISSTGRVGDAKSLWDALCKYADQGWKVLNEVVITVVNNVWRMILNGVMYVMETVEDIVQAISGTLLRVFETSIDKLSNWVGDVLDWEAIGNTYQLMCTTTGMLLNHLPNTVIGLHNRSLKVVDFFRGKAIDCISRMKDEKEAQKNVAEMDEGDSDQSRRYREYLSPAYSWALEYTIENDNGSVGTIGDISAILEAVWNDIQAVAHLIGADLLSTFKHISDNYSSMSFADVFASLLSFITNSLATAANGATKILAAVIVRVLDMIKNYLNQTSSIPLVSQIWKQHLRPYSIDPNAETPTNLQLFAFIGSVPIAYMIKGACYLTRLPFPITKNTVTSLETLLKLGDPLSVFDKILSSAKASDGSLAALVCGSTEERQRDDNKVAKDFVAARLALTLVNALGTTIRSGFYVAIDVYSRRSEPMPMLLKADFGLGLFCTAASFFNGFLSCIYVTMPESGSSVLDQIAACANLFSVHLQVPYLLAGAAAMKKSKDTDELTNTALIFDFFGSTILATSLWAVLFKLWANDQDTLSPGLDAFTASASLPIIAINALITNGAAVDQKVFIALLTSRTALYWASIGCTVRNAWVAGETVAKDYTRDAMSYFAGTSSLRNPR